MSKNDAMRYLSGLNKSILDKSIGAQLLIKTPETINTYQYIVDKIKVNIMDAKLHLKTLNEELQNVSSGNIFQKVASRVKLNKSKKVIEEEIADCKLRINNWEYTLDYYKNLIVNLKNDIDKFCKQLISEGINPQEVVDLYNELSESFEKDNSSCSKRYSNLKQDRKINSENSSVDNVENKINNHNKILSSQQRQPGEE